MTNFVQMYRSTDTGAPTCTGQASSFIGILNACLVNGYATASVTSITRSGTTATATIAANATLRTGDYITISGAAQTDYNGTFQITVLTSTTFTFQVANSPVTPATGTLLYKKAGLGWISPFTGTNKAVYQPQNASYPQFYFRVDETGATAGGQKECAVRGYETMSDVDTGTGLFPTLAALANGCCVRKSVTADATARSWTLVGDNRCFYFIPNSEASSTTGRGAMFFGGFNSVKTNDAYNCALVAGSTFNAVAGGQSVVASGAVINSNTTTFADQTLGAIARQSAQTGGAVGFATLSLGIAQSTWGLAGVYSNLAAPNPADSAYWVAPSYFVEGPSSTLCIRGTFPGLYRLLHYAAGVNDYDTLTNIAQLPGVTLTSILINNGGQGFGNFDTTGPW